MVASPVPARVHILLARNAHTAVAIRRGPSKRVCVIGWDRANDRFEVGQWLTGRIYERRCDLSPDGRHLIYFALNASRTANAAGSSWTAISRAPYLHAIGLWANDSGWNGGGVFLDDRRYWVNAFPFAHCELRVPPGLEQSTAFPFSESFGGECPGIYYPRLQRDGWTLRGHERDAGGHGCSLFERALPRGWLLRKTAHATIDHPVGKGVYFDTHELLQPNGELRVLDAWEWADWEPTQRRLVWIERGVLRSATLGKKELEGERAIHDFDPMRFEPLAAPYGDDGRPLVDGGAAAVRRRARDKKSKARDR